MIDQLGPDGNYAGKQMEKPEIKGQLRESSFKKSEIKEETKDEIKDESIECRLWLDRVNTARKYRDRVMKDMRVDNFYKEYAGEYDVRIGSNIAPPIGEVFAYVQASIATLYHKDPYLAVNANKKGTIQGAAILETAVNYYQRILRSKEEYEMELTDVLLAGHAWHKTGTYIKTVGSGFDLRIQSEKFYSNRVPWKDIVFNIGSQRPPVDSRWIAQRLVRPTDEVKETYGQRAAGIVGGPYPSLNKEELKSSSFKGDLNFSVLWEIHDIKERKIRLVAEDHNKYLKTPVDWPDYVHEFPFRMLWWNFNPDSAFPFSDISAWEPQILEKIKFLAMLMNHLKRWSRQLLVKKGSLSVSEMDKLEKGIDGSAIEVKTSGNPAEAAQPLSYAPFPPEVFIVLNKLDEIMNNVNGQPSVDRGAPQRTVSRTEGELEMIQQGSKSRTDRKVSKLEDHIESVGKDLIAHMQGNFDSEQIIKITGKTSQEIIQAFGDKYDPQTKSIKFTKDDIQGEYDIDVVGGSTLPLDKETRVQLLSIILDKATRLAQLPSIPKFMEVIIKEILRDYNIKSLEAAFDEQQQEVVGMRQQQNKISEIKTDQEQAKTEKLRAQAEAERAEAVENIGRTLHDAHQANVLPEAIALGRGLGVFPEESKNGAS